MKSYSDELFIEVDGAISPSLVSSFVDYNQSLSFLLDLCSGLDVSILLKESETPTPGAIRGTIGDIVQIQNRFYEQKGANERLALTDSNCLLHVEISEENSSTDVNTGLEVTQSNLEQFSTSEELDVVLTRDVAITCSLLQPPLITKSGRHVVRKHLPDDYLPLDVEEAEEGRESGERVMEPTLASSTSFVPAGMKRKRGRPPKRRVDNKIDVECDIENKASTKLETVDRIEVSSMEAIEVNKHTGPISLQNNGMVPVESVLPVEAETRVVSDVVSESLHVQIVSEDPVDRKEENNSYITTNMSNATDGNIAFQDKSNEYGSNVEAEPKLPRLNQEIEINFSASTSGHTDRVRQQKQAYEARTPLRFSCDMCSFVTKRQSHIERHMKRHKKHARVYACKKCDFRTLRRATLTLHEYTHTGESVPFHCDLCDYSCHKEQTLNNHYRQVHETNSPVYCCTMCDYSTMHRKLLKRHERIHRVGTEKRMVFQCPQCPYSSRSKALYIQHSRVTHSRDRPFLCDSCGTYFKSKHGLLQHRQFVHGDAQTRQSLLRHACAVCFKNFRSLAHLKDHETKHSTDKSHLCQYCGAKFKHYSAQKRHIALFHTNPNSKDTKPNITVTEESQEKTKVTTLSTENPSDHVGAEKQTAAGMSGAFRCRKCMRTFMSRSLLFQHQKSQCRRKPKSDAFGLVAKTEDGKPVLSQLQLALAGSNSSHIQQLDSSTLQLALAASKPEQPHASPQLVNLVKTGSGQLVLDSESIQQLQALGAQHIVDASGRTILLTSFSASNTTSHDVTMTSSVDSVMTLLTEHPVSTHGHSMQAWTATGSNSASAYQLHRSSGLSLLANSNFQLPPNHQLVALNTNQAHHTNYSVASNDPYNQLVIPGKELVSDQLVTIDGSHFIIEDFDVAGSVYTTGGEQDTGLLIETDNDNDHARILCANENEADLETIEGQGHDLVIVQDVGSVYEVSGEATSEPIQQEEVTEEAQAGAEEGEEGAWGGSVVAVIPKLGEDAESLQYTASQRHNARDIDSDDVTTVVENEAASGLNAALDI